MRKFVLYFFLILPLTAWSSEIRSITAQTTRMSAQALKTHFGLKTGDPFDAETFEKAKQHLQNMRLFKTLELLYQEDKEGVDIRIKADDHTYLAVMGLVVSGKTHSGGVSLLGRNFLKQGEDLSFFIGGGKNGFNIRGKAAFGPHTVSMDYFRLRFEQRFYSDGWVSSPDIFFPADDKGKYQDVFLGSVKGTQNDFSFSYGYRFSTVWSAFVAPEYEYYRYDHDELDTGNHSHLSAGLQYADDIRPTMNMSVLSGLEHIEKKDMLQDLSHTRAGKTAQLSYTAGGRWSGSDFTIQKWAVQGKYEWEFPSRQIVALFAKAQYALKAPFSNQVESSELLFGMGIYDREQRGKQGFSGGISLTYFPLRNQTGVLSIVPFYEQAYVSSGDSSYTSHSGVGISAGYRFWKIPFPLNVTFTHNLTDGSRHVGCKVGGHF